MKVSLRTRLIGSFLVVIATCGAITTVVGVRIVGQGIVNQAQDKVRLDLNSARVIYRHAVDDVRDAVCHASVRFFLRDALSAGDVDRLGAEIEKIRRRGALDILTLTDSQGSVLLRARNPEVKGDNQAENEVVKRALVEREVVAATAIIPKEELLKESQDLVERAHIEFVHTPKARPTSKTEETSGMIMMAAAPVLDEGGQFLGVLYGGKLLNRDYSLVDRIKDTVYEGEIYDNKEIGTATIFQGDLRVSTNVRTEDGKRAIGTRVSEEVHDRVLVQGRPWVERAFVVNDWYRTAYEPIRSVSGETVGILYVGMLERKFADMKRNALWMFVGISLGGIALSVIICYLLARTLMRPVNALVHAAHDLAAGDLRKRVQPDRGTEEIGDLGRAFNFMASSIEERDEQLRRSAEEQITKSERLALIGRLAAGIAHEINNPLGGILLFSRLLLRRAPAEGVERENLKRIANDAERCQNIVQGLLDFAHQREPKMELLNITDVAEKSIALLENQAIFHNIKIAKQLQKNLPLVRVDAAQMAQVFVNIIMNAAEAMGGEGTLTITTRGRDAARRIDVSFTDTGRGIREEDLEHLFEPFFTTKEVGRGTGLGLSISHGIVESHGGTISVRSRVGEGTTFTVSLPVAEEKT